MNWKVWKKYAFLVLVAYLVIGFFIFPAIGAVALICMLAPVVLAFSRGREWCGRYCPRGSLWDEVFAKLNKSREIPGWAKGRAFRMFMLVLIFTVFGWQMVYAWPDPAEIGLVFLRIIFITTLVGIVLALYYSPRTWCSFCPMGTLASWAAEGKKPMKIDANCVKCGLCQKACPLQLSPHAGDGPFAAADCLKCEKCIEACPKKALAFE